MTVCSGIQERIELALVEGAEFPLAIREHQSTCPSCASYAASLGGIVAALQAGPTPAIDQGLASRLAPQVIALGRAGARPTIATRLFRPVAAFATAFGLVISALAAAGGALVVSAALTAGSRTPAPLETTAPPTTPEASQAPATDAPSPAPTETAAPATEAPTSSPRPEASPTPEPTDVPRRTPAPVSPDPSEGESTAPTESTSP